MRFIFRHVTYSEALALASLETPFYWRQSRKVFLDVSNNPDQKLYRADKQMQFKSELSDGSYFGET